MAKDKGVLEKLGEELDRESLLTPSASIADEVWKDIYVDGIKTEYQIGSNGNVKSLRNDIILKTYSDKDGYLTITLCYGDKKKRTCRIHRITAEAFIPNPENKPFVNHMDGKKNNNRSWNLEWVTHQENIDHAIRTGLFNTQGSNCGMSVYTDDQIHMACSMMEKGMVISQISKYLGIHEDTLYCIRQGKTWHYIANEYDLTQSFKKTYRDPELKQKASELISKGLNNKEVISKLGIEYTQPNNRYINALKKKVLYGKW